MTTTTATPPEALLEKLRGGRRFLLTSHLNPDGDAIGTALATARLLRKMGKSATVWMHDAPPRIFRVLPGADRIRVGNEPPPSYDSIDTVLVLECPSLDRNGLAEHFGDRVVLNVDHHLGNHLYGAVNWVDSAAPAVGEMMLQTAHSLHLDVDPDTADLLYLALSTDTGGFRFGNTDARAFSAAADLVRNGASPERVSRWVYESQPVSALRLLGEMLPTLKLHDDGRIATVWVTREMFERAGAGPGDTEGLVDYPRSIDGVEAVAFFRELADGGVKGSLRSRGEVDIEVVAKANNGGGHRNAAGFSVEADARDGLEERIVAGLVGALDAQSRVNETEAAAEADSDSAEPAEVVS